MPLGSHGFAAPRAIVLHALRTFMPTHVLELGRPTLATLESTAFLALGFGVQKRTPKWKPFIQSQFDLLVIRTTWPPFWGPFLDPKTAAVSRQNFRRRSKNSASFDCFRRYATEVSHTAVPLGSHGFAATRAIVLHALRAFMPTHVLELGRPTLATLESTAFLALGLGPSMDKIFARVVIRLAASHCS